MRNTGGFWGSEFSEAVSSLCRIERVTLPDIKAIKVDEDEVTARIDTGGGRTRSSVYPTCYLFPSCSLGEATAADEPAMPPTNAAS